MVSLRLIAIALLLGTPAYAQSYGVGRVPSKEELTRLDISIGPAGEELPPGRGTVKQGEALFEEKGCIFCHGENGTGLAAPALKAEKGPEAPIWSRGRILPVRAPYATTVWDYIYRAMPLGNEGTLSADETYAITAYLLYINKVIPASRVLDQKSLPKVKMPIGNQYADLPDWQPNQPRLKGYPY